MRARPAHDGRAPRTGEVDMTTERAEQGMPIRDIPSSPLILTSHNGRWWINEIERVGPVRGSFATKEAAVAAGRALAMDAETTHIIRDESGAVIEARSYKVAGSLPRRRFGVPSARRRSRTTA